MAEQRFANKEQENITLTRIFGKDIRGDKQVFVGLTEISGISWAFSNAICKLIDMDKTKLIQDLDQEEIEKIETFLSHPKIPAFMKNRRKDFDSGEDGHLLGSDLKLKIYFILIVIIS